MNITEISEELVKLGFRTNQNQNLLVVGIKSTISPGIAINVDEETSKLSLQQILESIHNQLFLAGIQRGKGEVLGQLQAFLVAKNHDISEG